MGKEPGGHNGKKNAKREGGSRKGRERETDREGQTGTAGGIGKIAGKEGGEEGDTCTRKKSKSPGGRGGGRPWKPDGIAFVVVYYRSSGFFGWE